MRSDEKAKTGDNYNKLLEKLGLSKDIDRIKIYFDSIEAEKSESEGIDNELEFINNSVKKIIIERF